MSLHSTKRVGSRTITHRILSNRLTETRVIFSDGRVLVRCEAILNPADIARYIRRQIQNGAKS